MIKDFVYKYLTERYKKVDDYRTNNYRQYNRIDFRYFDNCYSWINVYCMEAIDNKIKITFHFDKRWLCRWQTDELFVSDGKNTIYLFDFRTLSSRIVNNLNEKDKQGILHKYTANLDLELMLRTDAYQGKINTKQYMLESII